MAARIAPAAVALVLIQLTISGQAPAPQSPPGTPMPGAAAPSRPPPAPNSSGIYGRVVAADTGNALRRARVSLRGVGRITRKFNQTALTDLDGRYRFDGIPGGAYIITAALKGFVEMRHGQRTPQARVHPWNLPEGQIERLDFALPRGSVISGRITDELGEPMVGVRVAALRLQYSPAGERPIAVGEVTSTDDRGEYRAFGLPPGTYVLRALQSGSEAGEGYATTYYPGTTGIGEARRIRIGITEQITADFAMTPARFVRVSGHVRTSGGQPRQNSQVTLRTDMSGRVARTDAQGRFDFSGIEPGEYILGVRSMPGRGAPIGPVDTEFAAMKIAVGQQDLTGLLITTGTGATISGRVVFDGTRTPPDGRQKARVTMSLLDGPDGMRPPSAVAGNGMIGDDGRFTIAGGRGRMLFRVVGVPGWQLRSVTLGGVDITDVPYDAAAGDISGLEIVLTDQSQALTGRVLDVHGAPAAKYVVVVFPAGVLEGAVPARLISIAMPGAGEEFRINQLPPGDYLAAAFESLHEEAHWDPAFRERVRPRATPFQLLPGRPLALQLSLIE